MIILKTNNKPANLDTLKFKLKDGQSGGLVKKDDGLYFVRGMVIIFR